MLSPITFEVAAAQAVSLSQAASGGDKEAA
jgi:hypothetical protein